MPPEVQGAVKQPCVAALPTAGKFLYHLWLPLASGEQTEVLSSVARGWIVDSGMSVCV